MPIRSNIISLFEDYYALSKPSSEQDFLQQLKDKEFKNSQYLAVPWAPILNTTWQRLPINAQKCFKDIQQIRLTNGFTYNQHDRYIELIDLYNHIGVKHIFCPLHLKSIKTTLNILPIGNSCTLDFNPNRKKDILYSFIGFQNSHPVREVLFSKIKNDNIILKKQYHFNDPQKALTTSISDEKYKDILERSIFSLCPRGSSVNSFRFWESLAAGAIPILIADDWLMPKFNWDETVINIPEEKVYKVSNLQNQLEHRLTSITSQQVQTMFENCKKAHNYVKKENYYNYIQDYIEI